MKKFLALIFVYSILITNVSQGQALLILLFGDKLSTQKFQMGINASLSYSNATTSGDTIYEDDFTMNRDVKDNLNSWDVGATAMLDYYFNLDKQMRAMRLGIKYYYGLTDIMKDNTGDAINNSMFLLSLGIPMGGSDDVD